MFTPSRPLSPTKLAALRQMAKGPATGVFDGVWGHTWNTTTIAWLHFAGFVWINDSRTEARITDNGIAYLETLNEVGK